MIASSPEITAVSAGHVTHDRYGGAIRAGGSAYYGAKVFEALGARSRLVTVVGEDFSANDELAGLAVSRAVSGHTTSFENEYPENIPRRQWVHAVARGVAPDLLPPDWRRSDVLFLGPVCGEVDAEGWLSAAEAKVVGFGIQGLLKQPGANVANGKRPIVKRPVAANLAAFRRVRAAFLSDEDLSLLAPDGFLAALRSVVPIVVVTRGASGATIFQGGGEHRVGVFPTRAVDPTGAGDTFAAAFLFALARGDSVLDAGRLGAAAASIVVEAEAGTALSRVSSAFERAPDVPIL